MSPNDLITTPEAAGLLGLSRKMLALWRTQPDPPIEPVGFFGRSYVYDRAEVIALALKRCEQMKANGGVMPRRPRGTLTRTNP